jgi:hypothetical protein
MIALVIRLAAFFPSVFISFYRAATPVDVLST